MSAGAKGVVAPAEQSAAESILGGANVERLYGREAVQDEPLSIHSIERAGRVAAIMCLVAPLSDDDQRVVKWLLERLPFSKLLDTCNEITERAREPALTANNYTPTPREHVALAGLLSAFRDVRLLVLGTRASEGDPR